MVPEIDVRSSVARKIYAGELVFEFEAEEGLLDIPFVVFSSPVKAELRYEICEDGAVEVEGKISFFLKGSCSRCLSETTRRIEEDATALFLPGKPQDVEYGYTNGVVRLGEFLRDTVMFAIPSRLLCETCEEE